MARTSFTSLLNAMSRDQARRQRLAEAEHRRQIHTQLLAERVAERARVMEAKEAKEQYFEE